MSSPLSDSEIRAALYYAVGVVSEGGPRSFMLSVAGDNYSTPLLEVTGNSGYSIGTLQTDLGQRYQPDIEGGVNVPRDLIEATQAWALAHSPEHVFPDQAGIDAAITDFGRTGRDIEADGFRDVDANARARVSAFLDSEHGLAWVHARDSTQIEKVMTEAIAPLQATAAYQSMSAEDQLQTAVIVGKLFNQHEGNGRRLLERLSDGRIETVAEVDQFVNSRMNGAKDFYQTGKDHARDGADLIAALRAAPEGTAFASAWADVQSDPVRAPVLAERGLAATGVDRSHQIVRELALDYERAPAILDAADRGAQLSRGRAPATGSGAMVSGDTVAIWGAAGPVHVFRNGEWESHERSQVQRIGDAPNHELQLTGDGRTESLLRVDPAVSALRLSAAERAERERLNEGRLNDREIQQVLRDGGFTDDRGRPLVPDGDFGQRSREALKKFEAAEGLPVDGELDAQSRLRLAVRHADQAAQSPPPLPEGQQRVIGDLGHPQHGRYLEARAALAPHVETLGMDEATGRRAAENLAAAASAAGHARIGEVRLSPDSSGIVMAPAAGAPPGANEVPLRRAQLNGDEALPVPQRRTETPAVPSAGPEEVPRRATERPRDAVFDSALAGVHAMDRAMGRQPDAASSCVAALLAFEWQRCGARGTIDGVVLGQKGTKAEAGEYVFAYSGTPERPNDWVGVRTAEAVQTPVEVSLARADQIERQHTLDAQRVAQQAAEAPTVRMG
jgi:hypothetical protein